jgi:alkanesulfonate monooxygenase SsuD/methylene tetrahydromethanopterin reductase-like flavin-dependent oxidoreductase (luciferase family)
MDPAGRRIERLAESLSVLTGLFAPGPFSFSGDHYRVEALEGLPEPVQRPHPPLLVGGGGPRMLALAARVADIVGVHCSLPAGVQDAESVADLAADRVADKVRWVSEAATAAGRPDGDIELQFSVYHCQVSRPGHPPTANASSFTTLIAAAPDLLADSPAVLVGDVEQCVDLLQERRERYGFSYLNLGADVESVAPLVARLAGT